MPDGGRVRHSLYYIYIEEVLSSVLSQGTYFLIKVGWCLSRRPSLRLFLKPISSIYYIILNHKIINTGVRGRTSLNPIVPIAPN